MFENFFEKYELLIWIGIPIILFVLIYWKSGKKIREFITSHPTSVPITAACLLITYILIIWFFKDDFSDKAMSLLASLIVGFFTLAVSILINYSQLMSIDLFRSLRIKNILKTRSNRKYYHDIIDSAQNELWILGVTANRLLEHFANFESPDEIEGNKVLLNKIEKGMSVRLLLASINKLKTKKEKRKYKDTLEKLEALPEGLRNKIQVKYYDVEPSQSIFYTEKECIVGPIFPNVASEHTPAIHLKNNSPYAEYYLKFFEETWKSAKEIRENKK